MMRKAKNLEYEKGGFDTFRKYFSNLSKKAGGKYNVNSFWSLYLDTEIVPSVSVYKMEA
jgi:hypothetical protein